MLEEENKKEKNILKEINNMATEEYSKEKIEELSKERMKLERRGNKHDK